MGMRLRKYIVSEIMRDAYIKKCLVSFLILVPTSGLKHFATDKLFILKYDPEYPIIHDEFSSESRNST